MQRLIAFPLHLEASRYPRRTGGRTNPLGQWTPATHHRRRSDWLGYGCTRRGPPGNYLRPVSYTHLRAHETKANLVCRLLLEKKKKKKNNTITTKKTRQKKRKRKQQRKTT